MMPKINWIIEQYDCVDSTLDILKEKAQQGAEEGLVVYAQEQNQGRGRHGNVWHAPRGNLYMSFLLRPNCAPSVAGQYSFLVAVALSKAIDEIIEGGHEKHLKWPNDVLIDGKKIAGILLESEISSDGTVKDLYVGVGVNILTPPKDAIAVKDISTQDIDVHSFLSLFIKKISESIDILNKNGFLFICNAWLSEAYKLNETIRVRLPHETKHGVFKGLDKDGTLLLKLDNGAVERITAGEVYF